MKKLRNNTMYGRIVFVMLMIALSGIKSLWAEDKTANIPIAKVNGVVIYQNDLLASLIYKHYPHLKDKKEEEAKLTTELVNRQLIREFLKERKVASNQFEFEQQWNLLLNYVKQDGEEGTLENLLKKLGVDEKQLKAEIELPLAWRQYSVQAITEEMMKKEFDNHKSHWDGTQVVVKQIFLKVPQSEKPENVDQLKLKLKQIRDEITSGKVSFSDAAKKHSESPSAENGGDIGKFQFYSRMPVELTSVAFKLKQDEISEPFQSSFGMHLYQVVEIIPGDFSFRDVRVEIFNRISEDLWKKTAKDLSTKAKIEYLKQ